MSLLTTDIWGDTVNTASRMESHGKPSQIQISECTYELLKDVAKEDFEFTTSGEAIQVKGKGQMKTYFVKAKGITCF